MKTRQEKALELRDLITKVNAIITELREDEFTVMLKTDRLNGKIYDVKVYKTVNI